MVDDPSDAEELAQDTFIRAWRARESYDPARASVTTWLRKIAFRLSLNHLRRKRATFVSIDDTGLDFDISDEELEAGLSTGNLQRIERLNKAILNLPSEEQSLLTMHYYEGLTLAEIAYVMDSAPAPVANRLYRIRKKLYRIIQCQENP